MGNDGTYYVELVNDSDSSRAKVVLNYFLGNADIVRFTEVHELEFNWIIPKRHGGQADELFQATLSKLDPFFIRKEISNLKYDDIKQFPRSRFTQYYYRLDKQLKTLLGEIGLFWRAFLESGRLYGFEDPTFYKGNSLLGGAISHELMVFVADQQLAKGLKE